LSAQKRSNVARSSTYSAPAIARAFRVIEYLAEKPAAKFREIHEELGIAKSSAHLILINLENLGYIYRDSDSNYRLSPKFFKLSNNSINTLTSHDAITSISRKRLISLSRETGLAVHLATTEGNNVLYLDKIEANEFVKFDTFIGKRAPLHLTAVGRALMMLLNENDLNLLFESLSLSFELDKVAQKSLKKRMDEFRKQGFAVEREEEASGVECIAVPIHSTRTFQPYSIGVISLSLHMKDKDPARIAKLLIKTAREISLEIGTN
jgi:DNA-binding IclR family transcriptional regulator